jgi:hypothetical protein
VDRFGVRDFGRADDRRHAQVALRRLRRADADRFVGQLHVLGVLVGFGVDDDRLDAHFAAGALDTQRDFTTVGDEDFFKHGKFGVSMSTRRITGERHGIGEAERRLSGDPRP